MSSEQLVLPLLTAKQAKTITIDSVTTMYEFLTTCASRAEYNRCRNTLAFNVRGATRTHSNQHGRVYYFADKSWLSVSHSSNAMQYGPEPGVAYGECKLWADRASRPMRTRLSRRPKQ